ncbi:DUF4926 domain-containing protein [Methylorubrum sp. SB2]|uniref:DUF4926 domain-containing protein n=1 Tax=Methylorubrum subtropicum TaxID=3138812 RepID=UPI00313A7676
MTRKSSTAGLVHPQHRLARNVAQPSRLPLAELSMVRLSGDLTLDDGRTLPAGATGAVVFVHAAGEAYEVEFITPFHAVATVTAPNLSQTA